MKKRILCLLLALLLVLPTVLCACKDGGNDDPGKEPGNGGTQPIDASTTENYLPSDLFEQVKAAFAKKDTANFPTLNYNEAPFAISDDAFAGKKIVSISLPVLRTGEVDADGNLFFTLYVMPNTYAALIRQNMKDVTTYTVKIKPEDYGIEAGRKSVYKYITVNLSSYNIQLTDQQTLAIGSKTDTVMMAAMATAATTNSTPAAIKNWREDWMVTGYHLNLFTGEEGKSNNGLYYTRNSLPIDFVFDYGTAEAKQAVVAARKAEEDAYNEKLKAVAAAYDGKYLSLMGDSISSYSGITDNIDYNNALANNRSYYSKTSLNDYTQMYWGRLADECNMELCVINGWSSSKVYGGGMDRNNVVDATKDNMLVRCTTLQNNEGQKPDVILLYMGINDVSSKNWSNLYDMLTASGSKTDAQIVEEWLVDVHEVYELNKGQIEPGKTYTSWEAAYALSLERMQYNYPDAEIYIMNLTRSHHGSGTEEKINKANTCLAALAEYYGVNIIDQANSEITYANCHYYGADQDDPVALHPNIMGHYLMTKLIVETLYENLPK